ncbi:unnamed protein product, partial [Prorocentrum cordatum]
GGPAGGPPYPPELRDVVPGVWRHLASALRSADFVDHLRGGRRHDAGEDGRIASLARHLDLGQLEGPPVITVASFEKASDCIIYGGKMQALSAEYRGVGLRPVVFHGAYDRTSKTMLLSPDVLGMPPNELECILFQLLG